MTLNLEQLLRTWCTCEGIITKWIIDNKYTCHQTATDLINILAEKTMKQEGIAGVVM